MNAIKEQNHFLWVHYSRWSCYPDSRRVKQVFPKWALATSLQEWLLFFPLALAEPFV